jgi:hypothetical protein
MSLSFWIRDYVFRPLAASRRERWWPFVVLVISMTLFGLWHGAKWTFIVFGVYHGLLLVLHRLGQMTKTRLPIQVPHPVGIVLSWGTTFLLVALGYILFRANDLTQAFSMIGSALSPGAYRHFALPHSLYALTLAIACGYFAFAAGSSLALSWRARYREAISQGLRPVEGSWSVSLSRVPLIIGALLEVLALRLWWWLAPAVVSLAAFVGLAIYTQSVAIPVTPFIYTLF